MLKLITCDKFMVQPREFRTGLNVVLGSSGGSNAIGKSTFLLILDFAFGGDDYTKSAKDVFDDEHVGHHQIRFVFEFDGAQYYFVRKTKQPTVITQTDSTYRNPIREMTVSDYRQWLFHEYKITLPNLRFDEIVERFFRIYGRGNHNEHRPLQGERESMATAVEYLMKLLGRYEDIYNLKVAEEQYGFKPTKTADRSITDITGEIGDNLAKIEGLERRRARYMQQNEEGNLRALGLDHEKTKRLAAVKKRLDQLDERKETLEADLRAIRNNAFISGKLNKDFTSLLQYFPGADLAELSDVEEFHGRMSGMMEADAQKEIDALTPLLEDVNAQIADLDREIAESGIARNLSNTILNSYARVAREIDELIKKNKELEAEIENVQKRKEAEQLLANLRKKQDEALAAAEMEVNGEMQKLNAIVTKGARPAPVLTLKPDKSFDFGTPDDKSEGTAFKNLVVYDLSMLALTPLPAIIHDSSIVKRIEDADFEQILGLYQKADDAGKQVFIAFDKADSYTSKTYSTLEEAAILRLSVEHELFGTSWSRNKPKAQSEPESEKNSEAATDEASEVATDEATVDNTEQSPDEE